MTHTWETQGRWDVLGGDKAFAVFSIKQQHGFLFSVKDARKQVITGYAGTHEDARNWVEAIAEWHTVPAHVRCPFPLHTF